MVHIQHIYPILYYTLLYYVISTARLGSNSLRNVTAVNNFASLHAIKYVYPKFIIIVIIIFISELIFRAE